MATAALPDTIRALYPFDSHFVTLSDGKLLHYIDEGPADGEVLVFIHGYPTWSYAYRALVVYYAAMGYRCIALDHVGFGLSDKPTSRRYHTLRRHIHNLIESITQLELQPVTLIMEGWGGPLGLGYAIRNPEQVRRMAIMDTWAFQDTYIYRLNRWVGIVTKPGIGELLFRTLNLAIMLSVQQWTVRRLSATVLEGYRYPFRDLRSRTALVQFPRMVNLTPSHPSASSIREIEQNLPLLNTIPTLILWGQEDRILTPDVADHWKKMLPRARGPIMIERAGHLVCEDTPYDVIHHLDRFLERTSDPA
ncbi:MAG TPA: alpha/beta fold hydrolase [Aggregatilineaceae bacterium]|nr:alpha/beta fold hydrolase [Aggregatilineaceae bacterium]